MSKRGLLLRAAALLAAAAAALPAAAQGGGAGQAGSGHAGVYLGASTCAQSGCHELTSPATGANIDRTEYAVWSNDPHADAYRVLMSDQADRIARNLGLGAPQEAQLCLDCHATNPPPADRGPAFNIAEGVGCESCHGPAGGWIDAHTNLDFTMEELQARGLFPTWEPVRRAGMCLDCHFGTRDRFAGHRLMGAGHPRVSFELDSYTELNAHHAVDQDYLERKPAMDGMRTWAIGQAVALGRRMELLADGETGMVGFFPEFVFFDCRGCHQPMSAGRPDLPGRRGQPKLDDANIHMLMIAAGQADPGLAARIAEDLRALHRAAGQGRGALVGAAGRMRETALGAVEVLAGHRFSGEQMRGIMRALAASGAEGRFHDYASAEQTALVLDSTLAAMINEGVIDGAAYDRMSAALDPVFQAVESDEAYSPPRFVSAMQSFRAAIE